MPSFSVFSIPINGLSTEEILHHASQAQKLTWIVTANPEILLYAKKDDAYRETLLRADLRIVDSFGLEMVGRMRGVQPHRIPGANLAEAIVTWAHARNLSIGLIGGGDLKSAKPALVVLQKIHPGLKGTAEDGGKVFSDGIEDDENIAATQRLIAAKPDIIFVAFGHPKQERWIEKHLADFPNAKIIIGVGGTFDYWAGTIPRAPKFMQTIGLEWLYRLIREPKRWKRILNALLVFPYYAIFDKKQ
ncbi:MAG: WecB/TagA/CpsF family glycosyltransferase [Candidatus Uhrbacteria bacterium]|nr:WecB/TagA/CpsF family glycosyltransferase [Candidatus Uhrbacteria bacterium]